MSKPKRTIPWLGQRNGVYYAFWYDEVAGRTLKQSLRTKDDTDARNRFVEFLVGGSSIAAGRPVGLDVSSVLDAYLREHVDVNTVAKDRQRYAAQHLKDFFKDRPLADVDIPASRGYANARREGLIGGGKRRKDKKGGDSTIRRELNVLMAAANHALRWKRVKPDQMPTIELPSEANAEAVGWLTRDQMTLLFKAADGAVATAAAAYAAIEDEDTKTALTAAKRVRGFLKLCYYTAGRRASIERLTRFQIDLAHSRINLAQASDRITKKRRPIVPIYPEIRPVIEELLAETKNEYLFGSNHDFYREFIEICKAAALDAHPHMLRHSRATHMLMDGEDIYKVAKLLGDTVATVERVYGHWSTDYLAVKSGSFAGA